MCLEPARKEWAYGAPVVQRAPRSGADVGGDDAYYYTFGGWG